ncbi:MAG: DNA polymerase IV [Candidatus Brocadiia bacterium]
MLDDFPLPDRFIAHIDMDAFFAAVEQRDKPELRDRPVIVGSDPRNGHGRGVVSTCSYEARKLGIHSAMPISIAYHKCPKAVFLPPDMEKYARISRQIYELLYDFTPDIETLGIDESFLDITKSYKLFGTPYQTCILIKKSIKEKTGLTASIGLAPTKMAAKIASDLKKPNGLVVVTPDKLLDFLCPLNVNRLWGLGKKGSETLNSAGIKTIGDLAKTDLSRLTKLLGNYALHLHQLANGIDNRPVEPTGKAKSVSNEITFDTDISDNARILSALSSLCEKVSRRLRESDLKCKTITLKIRFQGFETYTRSITIAEPISLFEVIYKEIKKLFEHFSTDSKSSGRIFTGMAKKVRLVGVKTSGLLPAGFQEGLFKDKMICKRETLNKTVDKIKSQFGDDAIYRATSRRK